MTRWLVVAVVAILAVASAWLLLQGRFMRGADNESRPAMKVDSFPEIMHTIAMTTPLMTLTSHAFEDGGVIPMQYTCDIEGKAGTSPENPPLTISYVPEGTRSLALIADDPDIPAPVKEHLGENEFDHWVVFDIPPAVTEIVGGFSAGTEGRNSAGRNGYTGPCPPREYEPSEHRYIFRVYALDTLLGLPAGASKREVLAAMEGHVIAAAELVGRYRRIAQ